MLFRSVGVLVAVLDLHRLACIKVEAPPFDGHILRTAAEQEGLDAAGLEQVRGAVLEGIEIEVAADVAIEPRQQVARDRRGDARSDKRCGGQVWVGKGRKQWGEEY